MGQASAFGGINSQLIHQPVYLSVHGGLTGQVYLTLEG